MMNNLKVFDFEGSSVRTVFKEGNPWWVAKDICDVFGETNRYRAMQSLDEDEKGYTQMTTPGGSQQVAIVNESGLYSLLFVMQPSKARGVSEDYILQRKKKLKEFRRWVTHDVLPSIRKHGLYAVDEVLANPDILIKALEELKAERLKNNQLSETVKVQEQQIVEMKPKASYYDVVLSCKDAVAISVIAKDYGKSARWLNKYLHEQGVQYKQGKIWLLYQNHAEFGYTTTKTHTFKDSNGYDRSKVHTYWTQKGRLFIYDLLKSKGILPKIEMDS